MYGYYTTIHRIWQVRSDISRAAMLNKFQSRPIVKLVFQACVAVCAIHGYTPQHLVHVLIAAKVACYNVSFSLNHILSLRSGCACKLLA